MAKRLQLHRKKTIQQATQRQEAVYDPFRDFEGSRYELMVARFFYFVRNNLKSVFIGLGVIFVLIVGFIFYDVYQTGREEKALDAFEELTKNPVMKAAADGSADATVAVRKLDEYMEAYTNDSALKRASLFKLTLLETSAKYKEAGETAFKLSELIDGQSVKAFYLTRAAILFEEAGENSQSLTMSEKALNYVSDDDQIRATLFFLQARVLRKIGKESAVRQPIDALMKIDDKTNPEITQLKHAALVFLLDDKPKAN
ncbi:MAG: tetratricopeptide repeat protein [Leptonema sp. (in: Bacteria)]|nr:tetratricopeptide repeat protein [Leptonema sp. (in: bacteria)]